MMLLDLVARDDSSGSGYKASLTLEELFAGIYDLAHVAEGFLVVVTLSVAIRMYVRLKITRQFGLEDWFMILTFIFALAQLALSIASCYICIKVWSGNHRASAYTYKWVTRCAGVFYVLTMMALKVSLGFFFLNIFSHRKLQKTLIYIIMVSSVVLGTIYFPIGFLTCAEIKAGLGFSSACPAAMQTAASALFDIFSVVNILGDVILVVMSCAIIWEAKLPLATKFSVCALLALGCIGAVASAIRFALVVSPTTSHYTQELIDIYKWCIVEVGVCIAAANFVMIRPLFNMLMVKAGFMTAPRSTTAGPSVHGAHTWQRSTARTRANAAHVTDTELDDQPLNRDIKREVTVVVTDEEKGLDSPLGISPSFDTLPRAL